MGCPPAPTSRRISNPEAIQVRLGSEPNDRIVSLSLTINSLKATNSGGKNINLLTDPITFEFTSSAAVTKPVASLDVAQDTYSALVFPDMTGEVMFYDQNGQPVTQSIDVPAQSVPVNFVVGPAPLVLNVFLDLSKSFTFNDAGGNVQGQRGTSPLIKTSQTTFTVKSPLVLTTQSAAPNPAVGQPESGSITFLVGTVNSVDTQNQTLTIQPTDGEAMQFSYNLTGGTTFLDGADPSMLTGMMVAIDGVTEAADGSMFATKVDFIDTTSGSELYGALSGYAPDGINYNLIVDGGDGANVTSALIGNNVSIDWTSASYRVNSGNLDLSGSSDLLFDQDHIFPGQFVEVDGSTLVVPDPNTANAGLLQPAMFELEQQTITGLVSAYTYDLGSHTGTFTLTVAANSPLINMNPGLLSVTVRQIPQTYLRNLSSITDGAQVKVHGLLFVDPNSHPLSQQSGGLHHGRWPGLAMNALLPTAGRQISRPARCWAPREALTQVLVVEDSAVYRKLIGDQLQSWGFGVAVAKNGSEAWKALEQADAPKLVLLDWVLPDLDGIELCQRIRQAGSSRPYVYVILLTGKEGREDMLRAMHAGADDYLVKPFDESTLKARLQVGKRILDLQEKLVAARESMRHAATHDSLTGLMNRGEILDVLRRELARAGREQKPVGILLADIDHFKDVNDSLGHLVGDEALQEIAQRLRSGLRSYDGIGRYGGEEFLLILPGCDLAPTRQRGDELRQAVARQPVFCSGVERSITVSMGATISGGSGDREVEALLSQADAALYAAKQKGRNRVECVEAWPGSRVSKRSRGGDKRYEDLGD